MDELIESLKRSDAIADEKIEIQNRITLHNAEIIQAKAPDFWSLVAGHVRTLCQEMMEAFPQNAKRHLFLETIPSGFMLNGGGIPRRILAAQLDLSGQRVRLSERIKHSLEEQAMPTPKASINISVGLDNELRFNFTGTSYDDPQSLARAFVSYVCGI